MVREIHRSPGRVGLCVVVFVPVRPVTDRLDENDLDPAPTGRCERPGALHLAADRR